MLYIIVACALLSISTAAVIPKEDQAEIVNYKSTNDGTGHYSFSFLTSNGISREEIGQLVNFGKNEHLIVKGSYSYTDPGGKIVLVRYTADENGYHIFYPEFFPPSAAAVPANVVASLLGK